MKLRIAGLSSHNPLQLRFSKRRATARPCAFLSFFLMYFPIGLPPADAQTNATSSSSNLSVTTLHIEANSLAWDPTFHQIYLTLPSTDGSNGNAVQVLNPVTGALGANVFAGSEPDLVAVSPGSQYLYVGLDGASFVQRFTLPSLGADIKISLGSGMYDGSYFAGDLQPSPASDHTVAVVRNVTSESPAEEGGVVIYDDASARANPLCGFIQIGCANQAGGGLFDSIQWNADGTTMFSVNNEDTGFDFYTVPVSASGFGKVTDYSGLSGGFGSSIHFDKPTGYVYDDNGAIIDPVAGTLVGKFAASGLMVPDGALGTAFFLQGSFGSPTYTLQSFDMRRFTPDASVTLSNIVGSPSHLIRWGSNGLAFTTGSNAFSSGGAVYILSGPFVGPSSSFAPAILSGGVVPLNSTSTTVQPGEWISIYGSNLATTAATWKGEFPTSLGNTSVTIDGEAAWLNYVSPGQINLQVPDDARTGSVLVVVTTPDGTGTSTVTLGPAGPSFPLLDSRHVAAIIVRSDGSGAYGGGTYDIVGPDGSSLGYPTVAAKTGDSVELFAVGLGPTTPAVLAGQPFSGAAPVSSPITFLLNNLNLTPTFAGISSAGLYQVNFTVPPGLVGGDVPVQITASGLTTPPGVVMTVHQTSN
jgi:uncharacterized protein (TIGR03437 family)